MFVGHKIFFVLFCWFGNTRPFFLDTGQTVNDREDQQTKEQIDER